MLVGNLSVWHCWERSYFLIIIVIIIIILRARNMPTKCDVTFPLETTLSQSRKS